MKTVEEFIGTLKTQLGIAAYGSSDHDWKRLLGLLEIAIRSRVVAPDGLRGNVTKLPTLEVGDYDSYPLYVLLFARLHEVERLIPQLPELSEHSSFYFKYGFELVRKFHNDPVQREWSSFLRTGKFGTISAANVRAYVRARRLTNDPDQDRELRGIVAVALEFIEGVSDLAIVFDDPYDVAVWYLMLMPELNDFFGDSKTTKEHGHVGTDWFTLLSKSSAVRRHFEDTVPFQEWMIERGEAIRARWQVAQALISRREP